ncbi:VWA-like domain-containing protein [Sulfurovum sp. zt1-1]|uniref:VWA-like domain-containing protein n=1 Tax=Sulfurovum zhangzhouensis TaxID=3019067 RepID=A0ABT7QUY0_9BACT|nr:VWA-like domain-containing protein [Sulfurovum zhangzhouensis]MDM5270638.1 VWA-like domain-containing protein [Sulfurovum zhangzhouensis]
MTYQEKLTKAKAKLMLEHPYFGTLASALKIESDPDQLTFKSDGNTVRLNEEYVDKLNVSEVEFILSNGAMHAVLGHMERRGGRDKWLWQEACDFAVNAMLVKNGLQAPGYVNYQPQFEGMYAEEIYSQLKDEMKYAPETNHESSGDAQDQEESPDHQSGSKDEPKEETPKPKNEEAKVESVQEQQLSQKELDTLAEELKEHFEQIFNKLKRQDALPKDLKFVVPEYFSHKVDWREVLAGFIASYAKSSYSFMPPNMKYLYRGIYLPSLTSDLLRIIIAIDTSGSVDKELLGIFLGEVESIMEVYPNFEIDIITADTKVHSHKTYLPGEPLEYEISGGGGTDFRPVFEYIDQNIDHPTALLFFTDGQGIYPNNDVNFDVMWIMPEVVDVPLGEVLLLQE